MNHFYTMIVGVSLGVMMGCTDRASSVDGKILKGTSTEYEARLEAAKLIQRNSEQDAALADLAKDAAKVGAGAVTKGAVEAIRGNSLHDTAASEASVLLAEAGKHEDATEVAKLIRLSSLRDTTLAKIVKGK